MPVSLSGIAFDCINNLRAALDQAGYAIAIAAGKSGKKAISLSAIISPKSNLE